MPRPLRTSPGGLIYHVLNRANGRRRIFEANGDYSAFETTLGEVQKRVPMRILAWCLMPNHWHLVLWPESDGSLSDYLRLVTLIHTQRWHAYRGTAGTGHVYQGRFKSFAVQGDAHFLTVCRYVEANALRAGLVRRAEDWRWCSLWRTFRGRSDATPSVCPWPIGRPVDWISYVNEPAASGEVESVRDCARRGRPYGESPWQTAIAERLGLGCTLRARGRPRKKEKGS